MTVYRSEDTRRSGARILDTAHGILIALRRCTMAEAFAELVQTAREHNLSPLSLAEALVALTENRSLQDLNPQAVTVVRDNWSPLLDQCSRTVEAEMEAKP